MKKRNYIRFFTSVELLVSTIVAAVIAGIYLFGLLDRFELSTIDFRFKLRGSIPTRPEVVFIDMSEDSIANIGRWPWPRTWHSTLVSVLSECQPRAVAFDVLFLEPSEKKIDEGLAEALRGAGNVYLPFLLNYEKDEVRDITFPIPELKDAARGLGFLDFESDPDGVVRRVPLVKKIGGKYFPHLAFKVVCDYLGAKEENIQIVPGKHILLKSTKKGDIEIPIDGKCQMFINWAGKWADTFRHYSYFQTLLAYKQVSEDKEPVMNLSEYRGRLCFIGLTAAGLYDTKPTPFETLYPMVGVHGNIVNCILNKCFVRELPLVYDLICLLFLSIMTGLIVYLTRPLYSGIISVMMVLVYVSLGFFLFKKYGLLLDMISPSLGVVFTCLTVVLYRYVTEEKQKRWIKEAFGHYLSPAIIEQLIENPDQLKLGGERMELTVMFSDIRSFTTYSESHSAEEVVQILNEYLDAMTKIILKNNGTLDKYVGDEIMAVWGAPVKMPPKEQAIAAVKTALEQCDRLKELHVKWKSEGKMPLGMGIGINTGEMISGNIGSMEVFDYTVIGDNVNIGARVEALTRKYDTDIIITESTYELIKDERFIFRELDSIVVKGKTKPVKIYSVDGYLHGERRKVQGDRRKA